MCAVSVKMEHSTAHKTHTYITKGSKRNLCVVSPWQHNQQGHAIYKHTLTTHIYTLNVTVKMTKLHIHTSNIKM